MTLISTTTLSGSSVTLSSIPSTYKNLQLIVRNFDPSADGYGLSVRVNGDSGANRHFTSFTFDTSNQAFNDTLWTFGNADNGTANGLLVFTLFDYTNTNTWKLAHNISVVNSEYNNANLTMQQTHHAYNQTNAITSLDLSVLTGTFTGTVLLYGVA
jgi:hypothetical protein